MTNLSDLKKKSDASLQAILWQGNASIALSRLTLQDYALAGTFSANATAEETAAHARYRDRSNALHERACRAEEDGARDKYYRLEAAANLIYLNMIEVVVSTYCRATPSGENILVKAFANSLNKTFSRGEPAIGETLAEIEKSGAKTLARIVKTAHKTACN